MQIKGPACPAKAEGTVGFTPTSVYSVVTLAFCLWAAVLILRAALGLSEPDFINLIKLSSGTVQLADDCERDSINSSLSGVGRNLDYQLPTNAQVFVLNQVGPHAASQLGHYFFLNYYLYPRHVGISVGQQAVYTVGPPPERAIYYEGKLPQSLAELTNLGYSVLFELRSNESQAVFIQPVAPATPATRQLYPYAWDALVAFTWPLWVWLGGLSLLRWLFPKLSAELTRGERAAAGFALGVILVTQLDFGLRLAGLKIESMLWLAGAAWGAYLLLRRLQAWRQAGMPRWQPGWRPLLPLAPVALVLLLFFRVAAQIGMREFDAVAGWAFKAKVFFHNAGSELFLAGANPAWGHAHLDYPVLVPMVHVLTYGAIGRVNEFVTKFWAAWMLLFAVIAILSMCRWPRENRWFGVGLVTSVVFLPVSLFYATREGATVPLLFFLTLGSVNLALALAELNAERLRLGLALVFGAALCKFEGMIILALWLAALLACPAWRALLKPDRAWLRTLAFALLCLAPYLVWRLKVPPTHPEAAWAQFMLHYPAQVLANFPKAFLAIFSRQFFGDELARWTAANGLDLAWSGKWPGFMFLFANVTFGYAWLGILLSFLLAKKFPSARRLVLALGGVAFLFLCAVCLVTSSLPETLDNLPVLLSFSDASTGGRYTSPMICAWVVSLGIIFARAKHLE